MTDGAVLVTGATGLLGPYLVEAARALGPVVTTARTGGDLPCDLTDRAGVEAMVARARPRIVLHAAALTDVDACQADEAAAMRINRDGTAYLAGALPPGCRLIYVSTDQVYPDTPGPHGEDEEGPVNAYGRSKLAAERAARRREGALVLRTNFFGPSRTPGRTSLSDFVARALGAGEPVTLFRDSLFSALHMATVAAMTVACIQKGLAGVFNLASREGMSKLDFGLAVARRLGLSAATARPGDARAIPGRAPRPADLRMRTGRMEAVLGRPMPTLLEEIEKL